jgi:hypothetical protein
MQTRSCAWRSRSFAQDFSQNPWFRRRRPTALFPKMSRLLAQGLPKLGEIRPAMVPHIVDDLGSFRRVGRCRCPFARHLNSGSSDSAAAVQRMKSRQLPLALATSAVLALSSCVYPGPEPVPYGYGPPVYAAPPPPPVAYRRCARGWHWVRGHHTASGRWVPGHCARNWVNPPAPRPEQPPPPPPAPAPAPPQQ